MSTNVFRIGDLQVISWFQFLPSESDLLSLPEKSLKAEHKDAANYLVLSAHLQLQNEGFLSTWTNSFVGPWDPSQGAHNPDEKIKLWLFLPGRISSLNESAQAAVSKLRVVGTGLWVAPGDSEEVAVALSQALRNSIERALRGLSYMRYGDIFTRCHSFAPCEKNFRRVQLIFEFVFAATEEAIYVHAIISAKHIRGLCRDDIGRALRYRSSNFMGGGLPVIVAPTGMRGMLTGCQPSDFVKKVYISKVKASNGSAVGVPFHVAQSSGGQLRGQGCYVEVTLGCPSFSSCRTLESNNYQKEGAFQLQNEEPQLASVRNGQQKQGFADPFSVLERTFIYPAETVLVPIMHRAFARSSLKRFGLQCWKGVSLFELWPLWIFSGSSHLDHCLAFGSTGYGEFLDGHGIELNGMRSQWRNNSSSNSNSSSISSISSTNSDSDYATTGGGGDLEADADSLACRQSDVTSIDPFENDGQKVVSKRLRTGATEQSNQTGTGVSANTQEAYKSEYNAGEANKSATAGVANVPIGSQWDWDDDDRGIGMDIQTLLSEFGDFGDFFEDEILPFGEPPGTAESQALVFPAADFGDVSSSPCTGGMHAPDQKLSPACLSSFDCYSHTSATVIEDARNRSNEYLEDARSSVAGSQSSGLSTGKFDSLTKTEAMMTFAPEYAAIEMPTSEFSTTIFRSPYLPGSKRVENPHPSPSAYVYSAVPPSPGRSMTAERPEITAKVKSGVVGQDSSSFIKSRKLYTHVLTGIRKCDKRSVNDNVPSSKGDAPTSMSGMDTSSTSAAFQRKKNGSTLEAGHLLLTFKTVLATEIECIMFQSSMCRIRHTLLSLSSRVPFGWAKQIVSPIPDLVPSEASSMPDIISSKYEAKKKDSIPARLGGDGDTTMLDGPITATVGVWRSVGAPKGMKPPNTRNSENSSPLPHNTLGDEGSVGYAQRQPLQDLLDALSLLVQQSTSFVDVSLDMDDGEGPYCWLALQEQRRRGFSCGPFMVHAGCGGVLSTCHSVDIAGVDLIDPLSAVVQVSSVISLLQSDIKLALKSAFGNLDGPLSVNDWCRGRSQLGDSGLVGEGYSYPCTGGEAKDSSNTVNLVGEPISPPPSTGGSSSIRVAEGARMDDSSQRRSNQETCTSEAEQQKCYSRFRPTLSVLPLPAILVGYQDDWLKTSTSCLQFWEKAPLEPYALPKPITYYAVCPDIDLLASAASDFFQQLGTVYEACKLGTHSPQIGSSQMELSSGKCLPCGIVLVDCPQQVKIVGNNVTAINSLSDYILALSKGWNVRKFVKALAKVLRDLKLASNATSNQKEGSNGPCMVLYVVCPFPEPMAVLQTLVESCAALGSAFLLPDKERKSLLHAQVAKSLCCTAAADEASTSNVIMLSGFSIPKLVLQIITVESLLRINRPVNELSILKEIAFTVYNKARRIPRPSPTIDILQASPVAGRSQPPLMHMTSCIPGLWKDSLAARIPGQVLTREGELDAGLRPTAWDSSWHSSRSGGLNYDTSRSADLLCLDDTRYMFEPLFILAEPGSVDHGTSPALFGNAISESSNSKSLMDDSSSIYMQSSTSGGNIDAGPSSMLDSSEHESKIASLHCCYGWTEDWRWLVCIWTDSRGELLDSSVFPFGGISSRQDTKVLQCLFVQVLHQGCQILLCASADASAVRPRDIIITRIGSFFELECQEWQKAIYSFGGSEVKKWPLQLRRSMPDGVSSSTNGASLQQSDIGLIQERSLPSSPSPSLYSPHAKSSSFMKSGLGQSNSKKQLLAGQTGVDSSRGLLQLVQSISLVGVSVDHSLHFVLPVDMSSTGVQSSGGSGYFEGFSPVKSLGSMSAAYLLIPSPSMRYLPPTPLQLPTCLTSESPPLAHLLHSKGSAIPFATGFVVSKAVPTIRNDPGEPSREDWPSVLSISLIDHYGGSNSSIQEKAVRGTSNINVSKQGRSFGPEVLSKDYETETHSVLVSLASELHSLSWMTVSPLYLERRTALPFHCDMLLRLRRLLYFADKEFSRPPEKALEV